MATTGTEVPITPLSPIALSDWPITPAVLTEFRRRFVDPGVTPSLEGGFDVAPSPFMPLLAPEGI
jgi:hypothetical protein